MALLETGLIIQACPLSATMTGTPQEWFDEYTRRLKILSATGTNFFVTGDVEPTGNAGPWLRFGTQWWVFDVDLKRYVPLDISASETHWFWTGAAAPPNSTPPTWLRTASGATINIPPTSAYGRAIGWYFFDAGLWRPFNNIVNSGTTAQRPAPPIDLEQFYDTDIAALIWFERGTWRTLSGQPGDIKAVAWPTLAEALVRNPGWSLLGASNASLRGRAISGATQDQGGSTPLTVDPNVPQRPVGTTFGETQGLTGNASVAISLPPMVAYYLLAKD